MKKPQVFAAFCYLQIVARMQSGNGVVGANLSPDYIRLHELRSAALRYSTNSQ